MSPTDPMPFMAFPQDCSVRLWLAGQVLPALVQTRGGTIGSSPEELAKEAFLYADALLAAYTASPESPA